MRIGLYPGTFDAVTVDHADIISRASNLVDKLVIGVAINNDKNPLFSLEERVSLIQEESRKISDNILVHPFENLLIQCARYVGASLIIRGLRAVADFEYEFQMAGMNSKLGPEIETIFLMSDIENEIISSKFIKEIGKLKGDLKKFATKSVIKAIKSKFSWKEFF